MKKSLRIVSALLLAVLLGMAAAAPASAKTLFVSQEVATLVPNSPKALEPRNPPTAPGAIVYKMETSVVTTAVTVPDYFPCYTSCYPAAGDILCGGKYYGAADGRALVNKYLENNAHDVYLNEGEKRAICDGVYYSSSNPSVCYYDYAAKKLVGAKIGSSDVVVYTYGGVPICRLNVYVRSTGWYNPRCDSLVLTPDTWNPAVGGCVSISARSASGAVYDDIIYTVYSGNDRAFIGEKTGKLSCYANGPVFIRARSASDDSVYGETLIYIGSLTSAVYDGCWSSCPDGIRVSSWGYDIFDSCSAGSSCVNGWIGSCGMYIPVIGKTTPVITPVTPSAPGCPVTPVTPTAPAVVIPSSSCVTPGSYLSYIDLLRLCYGDCDSVKGLLSLYNTEKYGYPGVVVNSCDYRSLYTAYLLGLILD